MPLTHKELVEIGAKCFDKKNRIINYGLFHEQYILTEMRTASNTILDVFAFSSGCSVEIECKTSHTDFLRNSKKDSNSNIAFLRYFLCEPGIIKPEELPERWGLLYTDGKTVEIIKKAECQDFKNVNPMAMLCQLYSIIRRNIKPGRIYLKGED